MENALNMNGKLVFAEDAIGNTHYQCPECGELVFLRVPENRISHFYHKIRPLRCSRASIADGPWSAHNEWEMVLSHTFYKERWIHTLDILFVRGRLAEFLTCRDYSLWPIKQYIEASPKPIPLNKYPMFFEMFKVLFSLQCIDSSDFAMSSLKKQKRFSWMFFNNLARHLPSIQPQILSNLISNLSCNQISRFLKSLIRHQSEGALLALLESDNSTFVTTKLGEAIQMYLYQNGWHEDIALQWRATASEKIKDLVFIYKLFWNLPPKRPSSQLPFLN